MVLSFFEISESRPESVSPWAFFCLKMHFSEKSDRLFLEVFLFRGSLTMCQAQSQCRPMLLLLFFRMYKS